MTQVPCCARWKRARFRRRCARSSGFDARGLTSGAARRQLQRALEADEAFRGRVAERFLARDDVTELLHRWSAREALAVTEEVARDGKLALLASTLYAARPDGWAFGFGVASAAAARGVEATRLQAEARGRAAELAAAAEARRRADAARAQADEEREHAEEALRSERHSRRDALVRAERERDDALEEAADAGAALDAARAATAAADARAKQIEARVAELEAELAEARRPPPAVDTDKLRDAVSDVREIADRLEALAAVPEPRPAPAPAPPVRAPLASAASRPRPRPRRVRPLCPPGVVGNSRVGLDGMLRTRGVVLVVDGYNVSKTAWADAPLEEQRERLVSALAELHLRIRCDVIVVFDGADVRGVPLPRRPGVRVVFSDAAETADDVVVREAAEPATTIPVVVATSDAELGTRAEAVGAAVVRSSVLLSVLRR